MSFPQYNCHSLQIVPLLVWVRMRISVPMVQQPGLFLHWQRPDLPRGHVIYKPSRKQKHMGRATAETVMLT